MSTIDGNNDQQGGDSGEITSNTKECTSQNNTVEIDGVCDLLHNMSTADNEDGISICANCGKEGNDVNNICNKCKSVKYCNAACKKKHRSKHKKACERKVAELHDEKLFKEVKPDECPICLRPMPIETNTTTFKTCCGKKICNGCIYAMQMSEGGGDLCPFCRTPMPSSDEERINGIKKLMRKGNGGAFHQLGSCYIGGDLGLQQDREKANELWLKAGELGCAEAYHNLGNSYYHGRGVETDLKKAQHYWELAAMCGDLKARHNLAYAECEAGNDDRAFKHYIIAAKAGTKESLAYVEMGFKNGFVTKDEYASTLRAYHERHTEMKSDERDKAAAHLLT